MAAKRVKLDAKASASDVSDPLRELKEAHAQLRGELDAERKMVRQLRRDKAYDVQQVREHEQRRSTVAMNNLRTKLHQEKTQDLSVMKDGLSRRFEADLQRALRQKDANIQRLERDLNKMQQQVAIVTQPRGLSTVARDAFENERAKLLDEVKQLRCAKKSAEENASRSLDAEKRMAQEMQSLKDKHKIEMSKLSKEADLEIKKLLEEIRSKNRQIFRLDAEPPGIKPPPNPAPNRTHTGMQTDDVITTDTTALSQLTADDDEEDISTSSANDSAICMVDSTDGLALDSDPIVPSCCEQEDMLVVFEKNKELEVKNVKLVSMARDLNSQLRRVHDELALLKQQNEDIQRECDDLMEQLHSHQEEAMYLHEAQEELECLKAQQEEMSINMTALQLACTEKERRIELLVHRLRRKRPSKSKPKVVRFLLPSKPYTWPAEDREEEEDRVSASRRTCIKRPTLVDVDEDDDASLESDEVSSAAASPTSDMSLDDVSSIASDSVFDENGVVEWHAADLELKYQHLTMEHLKLEREHSILNASQMDWESEKADLHKTLRALREQVSQQELLTRELLNQIQEAHEQNEIQEFQILELEEKCEKWADDAINSTKAPEELATSNKGMLESFADLGDTVEMSMSDVRSRLIDLSFGKTVPGERLVFIQACAMLDNTNKQLDQLNIKQTAMEEDFTSLEKENLVLTHKEANLQQAALRHDITSKQLEEANQAMTVLQEELNAIKQTNQVHEYREGVNEQTEARYREQITKLKRQLSSSTDGREAERELWQEKMTELKLANKRLIELESENSQLQQEVSGSDRSYGTSTSEERVKELQKQVDELRRDKEDSQVTISDMSSSREELLSQLADLSVIDNDVIALTDLKADVTECDVIREALQTKHDELLKLFEATSEKNADLTHQLESSHAAQHDLREQIQSMQSHIRDLTTELSNVESARCLLNSQLTESHSITELLQEQIEQLNSNQVNLTQELEAHNNDIDVDLQFDLDFDPLNKLREKDSIIAELEGKIRELSTRQGELEENLDSSESARVEADDHHKQELEEREENWNEIVAQLEEQTERSTDELREKEEIWRAAVKELEVQLREIRDKEIRARDHISLVEQENAQRIHYLQQQLARLEDNEAILTDSINQLSDVEVQLKLRIEEQSRKEAEASEAEQKLKDTVASLESQSDELRQQLATKTEALSKMTDYCERIKELERLLEEVSASESALKEDNYKLQLENDELQKYVDELVDEQRDDVIVTRADDDAIAQEQLLRLQEENSRLKEQVSELAEKGGNVHSHTEEEESTLSVLDGKMKQLMKQLDETERDNAELGARLNELESSEAKLKRDLEEKETSNKELHEKLDSLAFDNHQLEVDIADVREKVLAATKPQQIDVQALETEVAQSQVKELEKRLCDIEDQKKQLLNQVEELENIQLLTKPAMEELNLRVDELTENLRCCCEERSALREKLVVYEEAGDEELNKLKEKVDMLLDTEERMMERLQVAESDKECFYQQVGSLENVVSQLEEDNHHLSQTARLHQRLEREYNDLKESIRESDAQIQTLEELERKLTKQVSELEKSEAILKTTLSGMESTLGQKELVEHDIREQLHKSSRNEAALKNKLTHLEKREVVLKTRIHDLEGHNLDLLSTMKSIQDSHQREQTVHVGYSNMDGDELVEERIVKENTSVCSLENINKRSQEELVASVRQLQQMEGFHRAKISDLQLNLSNLRREIEMLAAETNEGRLHSISINTKHQEVLSEGKVHDLVRSETTLQMKVLSLQRQLIHNKGELAESRAAAQEQVSRSRLEVEALEEQVDDLRKAYARLKNKLQYGSQNGEHQPQSLARIQQLESMVLDLESSKRKLDRQVEELEESEGNLRELLEAVEGEDESGGRSVRDCVTDLEKQIELRQEIHGLISSEANLKSRISELEAEPIEELRSRISQLERSEAGLKRKLSYVEKDQLQRQVDDKADTMLDTPESVLKQRIRELEKMDRHLKQQIVDMERDREELHEIARKDKNLIHELNVRVRELQLAERNQRDQVGRLEVSESELQGEVDRLTDLVDDLEDELRRLRATERSSKTKLIKYESTESDLSKQLESTLNEKHKHEMKLKKQLTEADNDRSQLARKLDELTDRLAEQEAAEVTLKQKLRHLESNELTLHDKVAELEVSDTTQRAHIAEMEATNEGILHKLSRLEDEKTHLVYEMSQLEADKEDAIRDKERLDVSNKLLKEELEKFQGSKDHLLNRVDDAVTQSIELQAKLQTSERSEYQLRRDAARLQDELNKAHAQDEELSELKAKVNKNNTLIQAHELLKENYEGVKEDLDKLTAKIKKETVDTSNKSSQAQLSDSFTLRQLTPGFSKAIQILGTRFPEAYYTFVKSLKPDDTKLYRSRINQKADGTSTIEETTIIPKHVGDKPRAIPGTATAKVMRNERPASHVAVTSPGDRAALIDRLTDLLPNSDILLKEEEYWKVVEDPGRVAKKIAYWQQMEKDMGDNVDDVTLVFDVRSVTTDETNSEAGSGFNMAPLKIMVEDTSRPSLPSNGPPSFRGQSPGAESYYLPSPSLHDEDQSTDSADEADNIMDEDDGLVPPLHLARGPVSSRPMSMDRDSIYPRSHTRRGRSLDRDSDFSEATASYSVTSPKQRQQAANSVESIPDSGLESLREEEKAAMQKTIAHLQTQLKEYETKLCSIENLRRSLEQKDKQIRQLHLELDTLNDQLKSKDVTDKGHSTIAHTQPQQAALSQTDPDLHHDLEVKEKIIQAKNNENDRLSQELRDWQNKATGAIDMQQQLTQQLKNVKSELNFLQNSADKAMRLEVDLCKLQKEHSEISAIHSLCEKDLAEKDSLEKIVLKLQSQLRDCERTDLEKADLSIKLSAVEEELRLTTQIEKKLSKENAELKHQIDELSTNLTQFQAKLTDYHSLRAKNEDTESTKVKALTMITPLRAKVLRYAKLCKQKDEMISCLARELRQQQPGDQDSALEQLLAETDRELTQGEAEDYLRPLSPLTSHSVEMLEEQLVMSSESLDYPSANNAHKSKIPRLVSSPQQLNSLSSEPNMDLSQPDPEFMVIKPSITNLAHDFSQLQLTDGNSTSSINRTDVQVDESATDSKSVVPTNMMNKLPVTHLKTDSLWNDTPDIANDTAIKGKESQGLAEGKPGLYTSVKDYNPSEFSRSYNPNLDLALQEGDQIHVLGEADESGYCEAEVGGRRGLVPASYLIPNQTHPTPAQPTPRQSNMYPELILDAHHELYQAHTPQSAFRRLSADERNRLRMLLPGGAKNTATQPHVVSASTPAAVPKYKRGIGRRLPEPPVYDNMTSSQVPAPLQSTSHVAQSGEPDSPSGFRVQRAVGQHSVLLSWMAPRLDDNASSNGHLVTGYMVTIDNKDRLMVGSPHITKALVEKLSLPQQHTFSIQTLSSSGAMSSPKQVVYEGWRPPSHKVSRESVVSRSNDHMDCADSLTGDGDVSSVMSSVYSEDGERRVFMAVYDYDPLEHSPNADPSHELCFKAGDIVVTYGSMQDDGFYHAKVQRKRGLVPASFIEEVALLRSPPRQNVSTSGPGLMAASSSISTFLPHHSHTRNRLLRKLSKPSKIPTSIK